MASELSERTRRLWAGAEADAIGYGGVAVVSRATGLAISTVRKGRDEVRSGATEDIVRDRRRGAGRKSTEEKDPAVLQALDALVNPATRGDPESPLRWTSKSTEALAAALTAQGHGISSSTVGKLLREAGYSLQAAAKVKEGRQHPDRDAQFEFIAKRTEECLSKGLPVISVDTKKKELVGEHANRGREWHPKGEPQKVMTYDFVAADTPKAIPYGVYDVANNHGYVNVGLDHDTPVFAVRSIERWWTLLGKQRYPNASELFITADSGGSNSRMSNVYKAQLQDFCDRHSLTVHVSHFPPGTSKWNKIEHRLFSFISLNWRGRPLTCYQTIVALIASTATSTGLRVKAELDQARYPIGIRVHKQAMSTLNLERANFHGEWNYTLRPRSAEQRKPQPSPKVTHPVSHSERRTRWLQLFIEQRESGLSVSRFCHERGINPAGFKMAKHRFTRSIRRTTHSRH